MKTLFSITITLLVSLFTAEFVSAEDSHTTEEKYEQAYEAYTNNLSTDVEGIVLTSMMHLVELTQLTDAYDAKIAKNLLDVAQSESGNRVGYTAYLSLLALNHPNLIQDLELDSRHHTDYFGKLAETINRELIELELTTEVVDY